MRHGRRRYALAGICAVGCLGSAAMSSSANPDGVGTMTVSPASVTAGQVSTLTFTYTDTSDTELKGGEVTLTVPPGWTPPVQAAGPGGVSAGCPLGCTVTVLRDSPTIVISNLSVPPGQGFTITYAQATAPGEAGSSVFTAGERSFSDGTLTPLLSSPIETVTASSVGSPSNSASASPTPSPSASVTASASASASASAGRSVLVSSGPAGSPPTSAAGPPWTRWQVVLELVLLAAVVLAIGVVAVLRATRVTVPSRVRAVPHAGPPASVTVQDTGAEPTLSVRIEPHADTGRPVVASTVVASTVVASTVVTSPAIEEVRS
ncbi:MAG TPA: NEW3 domain-containing protein [Streptosporangiaceae bacterium]